MPFLKRFPNTFSRLVHICVLVSMSALLLGLAVFVPVKHTTTGSCSGRIDTSPFFYNSITGSLSLDELGNHPVFDKYALLEIQQIERLENAVLLKVSSSSDAGKDIGRVRKKYMRIAKKDKKTIIVIVDRKAWDVVKCQQRVKANPNDGDARFILGGYNILMGKLREAATILQNPGTMRFNVFNKMSMYEWLGYAYFQLGSQAKEAENGSSYFRYIEKEQDTYLSACRYESKSIKNSFFRYLYALTFIDIGIFLENIRNRTNAPSHCILPKKIVIKTAREAYEQALKVLLTFKEPTNTIYESRVFVYKKLGIKDKAVEERKLQIVHVRSSLYEKQRRPIREQILGDLKNRNLLTAVQKDRYEKGLALKYSQTDKNTLRYLDSLVFSWSSQIAKEAILRNPTFRTLPNENKGLLLKEIRAAVRKRLVKTCNKTEIEFLWKTIQELIAAKNYRGAIYHFNQHGDILASSYRAAEFSQMKEDVAAAQLRIRQKEEKDARKRELAKRKREQSRKKTFTATTRKTSPPVKKKKKTESTKKTEPVKSTPDKEKPDEIPMYKRVGILIDNMTAKKDYVGAYRGIHAYEKILKAHFNAAEIDRNKLELERLIQKEKGDKFLKELKKELAK